MSTSAQDFLADEQSVGAWFPPPYRLPYNAYSPGLAASIVAFTGNCRLYGFTVYNSKASAQYMLVFDNSVVPGNGAVPVMPALKVANDANVAAYFGSVGRWFDRGIVIVNSSTAASLTIGSADCWFDVQYV